MERLLRNLYGSTPQIDLDRKLARVRVVRPTAFDFAALVDGLRRNNVGYGGLVLRAEAEIREGRAVLTATGQSFPVEGEAAGSGPETREFRVLDAAAPARTRLAPRARS